MIWTEMTLRACNEAFAAHLYQEDKLGAPYFCHLMEVAERCPDEVTSAMGLLHDLAEDADGWNEFKHELFVQKIMERLKLPKEAAEGLWLLKHPSGISYAAYIRRLCQSGNKLALIVKKADLQHNLDSGRMALLDEKTADRLRKSTNQLICRFWLRSTMDVIPPVSRQQMCCRSKD